MSQLLFFSQSYCSDTFSVPRATPKRSHGQPGGKELQVKYGKVDIGSYVFDLERKDKLGD